jgi:preprotein translocase subunit SecE
MASIENVKPTPVRSAEGGGVRGWWDSSRGFLTEVRNEMKRVTWPSGREVYATTVVVILVSAFFGLYLWLLDVGLSYVVNWLFNKFGVA